MIERQMQKDGHRTWGYVIYRTTYLSDDDDWSEFLRRLRLRTEDAFVYYNGSPPEIDVTKKGWVKLIGKTWIRLEGDRRTRPNPNFYEPIEGVTERDVGRMKCPCQKVMTEYYSGNEGLNWWRTEYCRPPQVVGPPYDE